MTETAPAEPALRIVGVVPAAGASRRMGRTKALLPLDGRTFLRRVVTALSLGGCERVLVVVSGAEAPGEPTPPAEAVAREARAARADVLVNPEPGEGPITSLRLALQALDPGVEGIAYLPLDYPLVTSEAVSTLRREAAMSGASLTLPTFEDKRGHPAIFRGSLFTELLDPHLEGGARTVVHRHLDEACLVPFDDASVVTDVDTPEAYAALSGDE